MADDSELDYLKTFIDEATTNLTVVTIESTGNIAVVSGAKKCLVVPGSILSTDGEFYRKRFKIFLNMENEANLNSIMNEIIDGTETYNKRGAGFTFPSTMCNIHLRYSNVAWYNAPNGRWSQTIFVDVEFCTS